MSMGEVLLRCPACGELSYDPRETLCDNEHCRYSAQCQACGRTIHPEDYDPNLAQACSLHCAAELDRESWAER